jgi:PAS domain-containing protein
MGAVVASNEGNVKVDQKHLEIILLRQWASHLALPVFIAGDAGQLLFYNEPAERLLGRRYDEAGEMSLTQLGELFRTADEDGSPLPTEQLPLAVALLQGKPAHRRLRYLALDGAWRIIEVTAFPIEVEHGERAGAVALFWEANGE